jgi:hypothetical protein
MTKTNHTPEPDYPFKDIEREFLAAGAVELSGSARDALVQFYNVTVGHYLIETQPKYSYDLWRHDAKFRRMILEEVRVMAFELGEYHGRTPGREQIHEAGKAVMRRLRARVSLQSPWIRFMEICLIQLKPDISRGRV